MKLPLHLLFFVVAMLLFTTNIAARIYYVNKTAAGDNNGNSWAHAFTEIQSAIDAATKGDSICVAAGEYQPTFIYGPDPLRSVTFYINKSISLFGGFPGTTGSEGDFTIRNPKTHPTVMSGNIGNAGTDDDNAFHVVYIDHVSDSMRLDGFTIAFGNNSDAGGLDGYGAGIYNDASGGRSNPTLANNAICFNTSAESGGGIMNYAGEGGIAKPVIINCHISENKASGGGGISNYTDAGGEASPTLINCKLAGNEARTADGGAMNAIGHSAGITPQIINCIISGNHSPSSASIQLFVTGTGIANPQIINSVFAGNSGGALRIVDLGTGASKAFIRNSILWGNTGGHGLTTNNAEADVAFSLFQFGFSGEGNISEDPQFVFEPSLEAPHLEGDFHLREHSPAIDAGSNEAITHALQTDYDNLPRFVDPIHGGPGIVDMGPYEMQTISTGIYSQSEDFEWNVYPNPASDQVILTLDDPDATTAYRLINGSGSIMLSDQLKPGYMTHSINVSAVPAGAYFIQLIADKKQSVKKIILQ